MIEILDRPQSTNRQGVDDKRDLGYRNAKIQARAKDLAFRNTLLLLLFLHRLRVPFATDNNDELPGS